MTLMPKTFRLFLFQTLAIAMLPGLLLAAPKVVIVGDMEKPTGGQKVEPSPSFFKDNTITLHSAGNEVVAFQAIFQASQTEQGLDLRVSDLQGPATIPAEPNIQRFLQYYVQAQDASYSWEPSATEAALPWRGIDWPDALIPFYDPYGPDQRPICTPFSITPAQRRNQGVWVDLLVPKDTPAGEYKGTLEALQNGEPFLKYSISLTVHPFNLPDQTHVDAYGELYRENGEMFDSEAKFKYETAKDWPVYKRYLQMAHAHRFVATQRQECGPVPSREGGDPADQIQHLFNGDFSQYIPYIRPVLEGGLFTEKEGYVGPCVGAGPSFFPAPFPEAFYGANSLNDHLKAYGGRLDPDIIYALRENARIFWTEMKKQGWDNIRFFAYIMDEVDGEQDEGAAAGDGQDDATRFHAVMRQIQRALDEGTDGERKIHLIWTSHADAKRWVGTPADITDDISWWVPNGHAVNLDFFKTVAAKPNRTIWFYHSGQPAIGNHSINQLGIDLRLWGVLCWRYQLQGSFWWSMMCFSEDYSDKSFNPYLAPVYKMDDTRWGNGVLFYPGSRLTMIGARRNIQGPVPSMRMKAYRRGLQDYEYCWLAREKGKGNEADAIIRNLVPAAFSEAPKGTAKGKWSERPEDWYAMRRQLAEIIAGGEPRKIAEK